MLFSTLHQCLALAISLTSLVQTAKAMPLTNTTTTTGSNLEARGDDLEFLGYTGTEANQAKMYEGGQFVKAFSSGKGANLGEGIYLADTLASVQVYANSAAKNQGSSPMVCYFWSTNKEYWREKVKKVYIPGKGFGSENEALREQYAGGGSTPFVRVSELPGRGYQIALPKGTTSNIVVKCVPLASAQEQVKGFGYRARYLVWKVLNLSKVQKISAYNDQEKSGVDK